MSMVRDYYDLHLCVKIYNCRTLHDIFILLKYENVNEYLLISYKGVTFLENRKSRST